MLCQGIDIHSNAWGIVKIATVMAMHEVLNRTYLIAAAVNNVSPVYKDRAWGLIRSKNILEVYRDSAGDMLIALPHWRQQEPEPDEF